MNVNWSPLRQTCVSKTFTFWMGILWGYFDPTAHLGKHLYRRITTHGGERGPLGDVNMFLLTPKKGQTGHKLSLLGSQPSLFIMQESNTSLVAPPLKYCWRSSLRNYRIPQKRVKATSLPAACLLVVLSKMRTNRLNEDLAFGQHCRPTNLRRNCLRPRRVDSLI